MEERGQGDWAGRGEGGREAHRGEGRREVSSREGRDSLVLELPARHRWAQLFELERRSGHGERGDSELVALVGADLPAIISPTCDAPEQRPPKPGQTRGRHCAGAGANRAHKEAGRGSRSVPQQNGTGAIFGWPNHEPLLMT